MHWVQFHFSSVGALFWRSSLSPKTETSGSGRLALPGNGMKDATDELSLGGKCLGRVLPGLKAGW